MFAEDYRELQIPNAAEIGQRSFLFETFVEQTLAADPAAQQHRHRDPITILRSRLVELCGITEADVKAMDDEAQELVASAVTFAEESDVPAPEELFDDVVAEHGPRSVHELD